MRKVTRILKKVGAIRVTMEGQKWQEWQEKDEEKR